MLFSKEKIKPSKSLQEHQFLFIERPFSDVADKILLWGWASWWPKENALQYTSSTGAGLPSVGMNCQVSFSPFGTRVQWGVVSRGEIVQLKPKRVLQIEWRKGMIVGQEFVIVEERSNGTRLDHRVRYTGSNLFAKMIWAILFRKRYQDSIRHALAELKKYLISDGI